MARPRHVNPTPAELEVLQIIWKCGPSTVREVMTVLNQERRCAYTSVMSLMNVMVEKGLLSQRPKGRAFVYATKDLPRCGRGPRWCGTCSIASSTARPAPW